MHLILFYGFYAQVFIFNFPFLLSQLNFKNSFPIKHLTIKISIKKLTELKFTEKKISIRKING